MSRNHNFRELIKLEVHLEICVKQCDTAKKCKVNSSIIIKLKRKIDDSRKSDRRVGSERLLLLNSDNLNYSV